MKVQKIQQQQNNNLQQNTPAQFKGAGDSFLRYLATNQAVGANGVDLCFMVIPRTGSDMIRRGPLAGFETLRREIMGTINDSLIGVYGMAAGVLAASLMGFNKKYGTNYVSKANSTGYLIGSSTASATSLNLSKTDDKLFVEPDINKAKAMWIASPSSSGANNLIAIVI